MIIHIYFVYLNNLCLYFQPQSLTESQREKVSLSITPFITTLNALSYPYVRFTIDIPIHDMDIIF